VNFSHSPPFSFLEKKSISSFSLLITRIQSLLKKQDLFLSRVQNTTKQPSGVLIVFDELFAADKLEDGFAQKLLSIGKVSVVSPLIVSLSHRCYQNASTNIKVIGIQRSPPDRCLGHIHLPFTPYTIPQLLSIIEGRLATYQPSFASSSDLNSSGPSSSTLTLTPQQTNQFLSLARDSIHHITFRTHEIEEIWATLTTLWEKHFRLPPPPSTVAVAVTVTGDLNKFSSKFLETEIGIIFKGLAIHTVESSANSHTNRQRKDGISLKRSLSTRSNDSTTSDSNRSTATGASLSINMNTCKALLRSTPLLFDY
jgi:hypothetical protein